MLNNKAISIEKTVGLRQLIQPNPVQVIAITAGKGGVGKSSISVNLAAALAELNRKVLLFDADLGLANIDIMLGLKAKQNLFHVIDGSADLNDVILRGPNDIQVIPGASGIQLMSRLSAIEHAGIIQAFSEIDNAIDTLIIDTATGISEVVVDFLRASQEIIVVICDEPASLVDAHSLIKLLSNDYDIQRFHVLCNRVASVYQAKQLYKKFQQSTDPNSMIILDYLGFIPEDNLLKKAIKNQKSVVLSDPNSRVSRQFKKVANQIVNWPVNSMLSGNLSFFIERYFN